MLQLAQNFFELPGQWQIRSIWYTYQYFVDTDEKQGSKCIHIISLLKKISVKHFKTFHEFADTANEFNKLFLS